MVAATLAVEAPKWMQFAYLDDARQQEKAAAAVVVARKPGESRGGGPTED